MRAKKIIAERMKERGYTLELFSKKCGYKTISGISERLRPGKRDMQIDVFLKMLEQLDCELVVRSTLKDDKKEWVVSMDGDDK